MKTYQDLLNATDRIDFINSAIAEHKGNSKVKLAITANDYYNGENTTIMNYFKILYDMQGKAHKDDYAANHKITSNIVQQAVDQEVSYLLSNGINFTNDTTLEKLGNKFERSVSRCLQFAELQGVCFGFWNSDHLEIFPLIEDGGNKGFVPLYDEEDGTLKAGIRFWQLDSEKPLKVVLYEVEGLTEYIKEKDKTLTVVKERTSYKTKYYKNQNTGAIEKIEDGGNYPTFPIVPMNYNRQSNSILVGKRNTVDALDLVSSNMVNNVDEANLIYWVLTNCQGMDDTDDKKFIEQLKATHVVHADGDAGARAEAHSIDVPYAAVDNAIQTLTRKLYDGFRMFDASIVIAGNQTNVAIRACYANLDLKADRTEEQVTEFIEGILALANIDDKPTYTRNMLINKMEEIQSVLAESEFLGDEYTTKKLLTINGDVDMFDEIQKKKIADELNRLALLEGGMMNNDGQGAPADGQNS